MSAAPWTIAIRDALPRRMTCSFARQVSWLWDHHANLIVDFLPGAFTATT